MKFDKKRMGSMIMVKVKDCLSFQTRVPSFLYSELWIYNELNFKSCNEFTFFCFYSSQYGHRTYSGCVNVRYEQIWETKIWWLPYDSCHGDHRSSTQGIIISYKHIIEKHELFLDGLIGFCVVCLSCMTRHWSSRLTAFHLH